VNSLSEVSLFDFKKALDQTSVRISQIIFIGLTASVVVFSFIVFMVSQQNNNVVYNKEILSTLYVMSIINLVITVSSIIVGKYISDRQFSESNLQSAVKRDYKDKQGNSLNLTPEQKCLSVIRTASIIRLATMEGAAFFGLVAMMQVVQSGIGIIEPVYYANILSILPLFIYVVTNFPNAERIEEIFKKRIQKTL
jgi:uncharacterized membrane protein